MKKLLTLFLFLLNYNFSEQQCQSYQKLHFKREQQRVEEGDHFWLTKSEISNNHNSIQKHVEYVRYKDSGYFLSPNCTEVLAQVGSTATLHCEVTEIGESTVSWIRKSDYQLLTVGLTTYSSDERFFTSQGKNTKLEDQDWSLHLRYVTENDAGVYECQVSTYPPCSIFIELQIVEAQAEIIGGTDKIVKSGSPLRLVCLVRRSTAPAAYLFWYHGDRMINFDLGGGAAVRHGRYSSELVIPRAAAHHAGNYTCEPSNARPASVLVHVLHNEKPAAMQHGSKSSAPTLGYFRYGVLLLVAMFSTECGKFLVILHTLVSCR